MAEPVRAARPAGTGPKVPLGQRTEWPVEWQPVEGTADGFGPRLVALAAQVALNTVARLPRGLLDPLIGGLARLGRRIDRRHADAARGFLRQALGPMPATELEERVLQAYRHFLRVAVDTHRFPRVVPREEWAERFDIEWNDDMVRSVRSGEGAVIVTGHIGSWEAALAAMPVVGWDPGYGIAKAVKNRPLSVATQRERERRGVRVLPRRGAMTLAPQVLRAGGAIGMVVDQRANKRPLLASFFGRPARCDRSAAVLLRPARSTCVRDGHLLTDEPQRYRVECFDRILPDEVARMDNRAIVERINRAFEAMIKKHPEQYFWLHDRYRDTPTDFPDDLAPRDDIERAGEAEPADGPVSSERDPASSPGVEPA